MLTLYRRCLELRAQLLTPTQQTTIDWLNMGKQAIAYSRNAAEDSGFQRIMSITNFGTEAIELPKGTILLSSHKLPQNGTLPQDVTVWIAA